MTAKKPLYAQIIEYIKNKIVSGQYLPGQSIPNEKELAELFHVSRITSKKALEELHREGIIYRKRRGGSFVSHEWDNTREGSIQNSGDQSHNAHIISIVLPILASDGGMMSAVEGITSVLGANGYFAAIHNTCEDITRERQVLHDLVDSNVAGIILYPYSDHDNLDILTSLCMNDFPIVAIDKYFESIPLSYVVSDNFGGGYMMTQYLIDKGHKKIAYASHISLERAKTVRNRYLGYCKALKDNRIKFDDNVVVHNYIGQIGEDEFSKDQEMYYRNLVAAFRSHGATAIQAVNDDLAVRLEKACHGLGLRIPDDIAVAGFDNTEISAHVEVPLTTVKQDFFEMGKKAAEMVLKKIRKGNHSFRKVILPVSLVERQSTCVLSQDKTMKAI